MMVRYEDREGVGIFCPAIAVEFFYQSVALIGYVLERSRKFRTRIVFLFHENYTTLQA